MNEKSIPPRKNELMDTSTKPTVKLPQETSPIKIRSDKPKHLSSTYSYDSDLSHDKIGAGISTTDSRVGEPKKNEQKSPILLPQNQVGTTDDRNRVLTNNTDQAKSNPSQFE